MIDVINGNSASDLGVRLDRQPTSWLGEIAVVATDLAESYRAGLSRRLDHPIRVADPFHVVRVRHEAAMYPGGMKGSACGLSQQPAEAEGSPIREARGGWQAALMTTRRAGTARRLGPGRQDGKV